MQCREVVIVNGYGCALTPDLKHYLDTILAYVKKNRERISYVICSGGFTDPGLPKISEADLMADYVQARRIGVPVVREKNSYSTTENLMRAARIIKESTTVSMALAGKILPYVCDDLWQATVFCRHLAYRKVQFFAPRILPKRNRVNPVTIFGIKVSATPKDILVYQVAGTIVDILGWYVPAIRRLESKVRRKKVAPHRKV